MDQKNQTQKSSRKGSLDELYAHLQIESKRKRRAEKGMGEDLIEVPKRWYGYDIQQREITRRAIIVK